MEEIKKRCLYCDEDFKDEECTCMEIMREEMKPTPRHWGVCEATAYDYEDRYYIEEKLSNGVMSPIFNHAGVGSKSDCELIVSAVNQSDHVKILVEALEKIASCEKITDGDCVDVAQKGIAKYRRATEGK